MSAMHSDAKRGAVACFMTARGPLFLYSMEALSNVFASFPHAVESNSAECNNKSDGFTVDEWAAYARKKSAIASSVAKLNGVLKTKLAALRSSGELIVGCPPGNTTGGIETNIAQCMADACLVWLGKKTPACGWGCSQ